MGTYLEGEAFRCFDSESVNLLALRRLISGLIIREGSIVSSSHRMRRNTEVQPDWALTGEISLYHLLKAERRQRLTFNWRGTMSGTDTEWDILLAVIAPLLWITGHW